jgi:hypothetical protein
MGSVGSLGTSLQPDGVLRDFFILPVAGKSRTPTRPLPAPRSRDFLFALETGDHMVSPIPPVRDVIEISTWSHPQSLGSARFSAPSPLGTYAGRRCFGCPLPSATDSTAIGFACGGDGQYKGRYFLDRGLSGKSAEPETRYLRSDQAAREVTVRLNGPGAGAFCGKSQVSRFIAFKNARLSRPPQNSCAGGSCRCRH